MNLKGNTILVTGATSGIGLALARQLQRLGNTVIITGRNADKLAKVQKENPELKTIRSDVGDVKEIEALHATLARDFPELNVIVNNAGIMRMINLHKEGESLESLTREIEVNLMGPIRMVATFLPSLKKRPHAAIVNVSSGLAFVPLPTSPIYCATKAAIHSYTLSLRAQLKNTHVKVFELAPPTTETELLTDDMREDLKAERVKVMPVEELAQHALRGLERDQLEIRPGQANQLRFMNRLAPDFILRQLSKPVDRMVREP
jgi:uncharacterized oxidoreductase